MQGYKTQRGVCKVTMGYEFPQLQLGLNIAQGSRDDDEDQQNDTDGVV